MSDQHDNKTGKKPWPRPQIIEVGLVEEQTTAGVGNIGDNVGTNHWKPGLVDVQQAVLPDGE